MSFDLTNKNIQDTFQNLLQRTGSDNHLYDLEGNKIGDLRISGSLIAQQYIVSSSVTNITTQQLSGSTQFGNSLDDTHQFTGSLNVTGSITKGNIPFVLSNQTGSFLTDITSVNQGAVRKTTSGVTGISGDIGLGLRTTDNVKFNHITASGDITASGNILNSQVVQMTNSSSVIDTFNTGSFRSAKYTLQVTSASNYQVSEMLVLHNDGTALNTEYAQINSGLNLLSFTTTVSSNFVKLNAAGNFISCSVRYERTIIPN